MYGYGNSCRFNHPTHVGQRNYRFFFMFVFSATLLCIFVFVFCWVYVIKIKNSEEKSCTDFADIYNIEKFVSSLAGVVKVVKTQSGKLSSKTLDVLRISNRVTEEYITENIEPVFKSKGNISLVTYFPSVNMKKGVAEQEEKVSVGCLAMFGTLALQPEVREVVDSMVDRLKTLSRKSDGEFVAVDVRLDMLDKKGCQGSKKCYSRQEIALFLKQLERHKLASKQHTWFATTA